jgi:type VI secretion system protein VasD
MKKHRIYKTLSWITILVVSTALAGCGAFSFLGFGMASVNLQPSKTMNVGDEKQPLPIEVRIYQLKSDYKMKKADFKSIWKNDKGVLDETLLDKKEVMVYPGKNLEIEIEKKDEAKYIGVAAIFRKPDEESDGWKHIIELSSWNIGSQDIDLIIGKNSLKVGVLEEEENHDKNEDEKTGE